ncbi:hypothetical protein C2E23DRAFT_744977 [Lenzites betulinus]|nr:hypothetical protein C2E23DRAFT_744977 [Lenzites betulinus]
MAFEVAPSTRANDLVHKSTDSNPPWYVASPHWGGIDPGGIPDRLLRHPELHERGLVPFIPAKPGVVFSTTPFVEPIFIIKILNTEREEYDIYKRLLSDENQRPNNHTLPSELTRTGHPLLIMPKIQNARWIYFADWPPHIVMDIIFQLVEGMEFLHSLHIVHMDMCRMNVMASLPQDAEAHENIIAHRLYIIDFDSSKQFALGPGVQSAVVLPETQTEKPDGLQLLDPYSWDVYCVGHTLERLFKQYTEGTKQRLPWTAERYIKWLIGSERGCTGVCRCRPTARTALRVIKVLVRVVDIMENCCWMARVVVRL